MSNIDQILKDRFKLEEYRLGQREIIESVLSGKDVLALMPTGGGKSLCYQVPAFSKPGLTLVVSPLIALMNDQVRGLKALNLPAGCLHSGLTENEKKAVFTQMRVSESYILYVSPERVQQQGFSAWVKARNVNLIAIDEAHCVSQWGHDFRPDYAHLSRLREWLPDVPMIGLTATATPLVKKDIVEQLKLRDPDQHVYGFYRPNLFYQVEFCEDEADRQGYLCQAIEQVTEGRVIIYCGTRRKVEETEDMFARRGESVAYYHAGLPPERRKKIESDFTQGKIRILAATNAFGMGVDIPDIRLVIHTQMPGNIESYYQEVGRAGRDGHASTCLLLYTKKDRGLHAYFINQSRAQDWVKSQRWNALDAMVTYSEGSECRHGDILTYFKDQVRIKACGHCDACDKSSTRRIMPPEAAFIVKPKKSASKKKQQLIELKFTPEQNDTVKRVRAWRRDYAKDNEIPAFMVFSDKTLKDLVSKSPVTAVELERVYGMGEKKIEAFGRVLLDLL